MKKRKLAMLAALGIMLQTAYAQGKMTPDMQSFYEQLTPDAREKFLQLDDAHRKAAMQVIEEQSCKGASECKGHREQSVEKQYNNQMQQRRQTNKGLQAQ